LKGPNFDIGGGGGGEDDDDLTWNTEDSHLRCSLISQSFVTVTWRVFSVAAASMPVDWRDSEHVICVFCISVSVPRLYKRAEFLS
jgi:hypothetical protein